MSRPEWQGRTSFAEVAETLGVPTNLILAAVFQPDSLTGWVWWTPDEVDPAADDTPIRCARLKRDAGGVLVVDGLPRTVSTLGDFRRYVDERLGHS